MLKLPLEVFVEHVLQAASVSPRHTPMLLLLRLSSFPDDRCYWPPYSEHDTLF